jgi:GNAT superfamily N-acetyltransferase
VACDDNRFDNVVDTVAHNLTARIHLTVCVRARRILRAGGYRREAGRAACRLDVSDGVDAIFLPTKFFPVVRDRFNDASAPASRTPRPPNIGRADALPARTLAGMRTELSAVDPTDEAAIDDYHSIEAAHRAADVPDLPPLGRAHVAASIRFPSPASEHTFLLGLRGGRAVGLLKLDLPQADNRHVVGVELHVHPDQRRQGVGRELFAAAIAVAREHGRDTLIGDYCAPLAGGPQRSMAPEAFATAMGAKAALDDIRRRLDLSTVDIGDWERRYADAVQGAQGYTAVSWSGAVPDEYVADVAYLEGRMVIDSPMGELRYEQEKVDAERIRALDEMLRKRGQRSFDVGVRHDATGRLVAWTALVFDVGEFAHAWQGTTIVDPDHRGHGLGLLVKLGNLRQVRVEQPELRTIDTWNAAENRHMIAINEALGFVPVDRWVNWQYDVDTSAGSTVESGHTGQ